MLREGSCRILWMPNDADGSPLAAESLRGIRPSSTDIPTTSDRDKMSLGRQIPNPGSVKCYEEAE